jgi:hypothetical protein
MRLRSALWACTGLALLNACGGCAEHEKERSLRGAKAGQSPPAKVSVEVDPTFSKDLDPNQMGQLPTSARGNPNVAGPAQSDAPKEVWDDRKYVGECGAGISRGSCLSWHKGHGIDCVDRASSIR